MNKKVIERNFSRYAHNYDSYATVQRSVASALLQELKNESFQRILELGCGTGAFTSLLKTRFPEASIIAVDFSAAMIAVAKEKLADSEVEFIVCDAELLNLEGPFDLISSNACFQWFEDPERAILRYKKMLSPEGKICFSIFGPRTFNELNTILNSCFHNISISVDGFIHAEKIKEIMQGYFTAVQVKDLHFSEEFLSLKDLLYKIKYTGTRGEGAVGDVVFNRKALMDLESQYLKQFKKIIASYEVFICQARAG